jgi:hypothetical protein
MLICFSLINIGNRKRQIWIEAHSSLRPDHLYLNALFASWISPAPFFTYNSSKLYFRGIVLPLQRKLMMAFTLTATALIQLVHFSSIALLLNLTDFFEPSTSIIVAR